MSKNNSFSNQQLKQLQQLKKDLTASQVATPKINQTKPKQDGKKDLDDHELFNQAMQGVQPLPEKRYAEIKTGIQKPDAQILAKRVNAEGVIIEGDTVLSDTQALLNPVASQANLSYRIATLQYRVFEDLKAGRLRWYEAVDLHGCTVEQAREAVLQIIQMAHQDLQNVIKIVHGKGKDGVLKSYVNTWLRQHPQVLAFVSAPIDQGGTGAVLVLLKRRKDRENDTKSATR
ncbi:Smr/MutS family protein [Acinetobacter sp. c3-l95]|uniref:Smr/MutS family protein n=1 Tax=Acinetobacter sp. c3-l95 TaxID=3342804 RepID=UPI0035BB2C1A